MRNRWVVCLFVATLVCVSGDRAGAAPQLSIDSSGYRLVSKIRISRIAFLYTYRATVVNTGTDAYGVQATISTAAPNLFMADAALSFGSVPAGARVLSTDTFTVRQVRNARISGAVFVSSFAAPPPFTLQLGTNDAEVFQDSTITLSLILTRAPGFTADVTVNLEAPPDGVEALPPTFPAEVGNGAIRIRVDRDAATGVTPLSVVSTATGIDPVNQPLTLRIGTARPRSQSLIASALAAGTIDYGTSLLYRAYAWFGDARLPAAYRGSGSVEEDLGVVPEIAAALGTLSPALEAELVPFTLRPSHPGSWFSRAVSGASPSGVTPLPAPGPEALLERCEQVPASGGWISRRSATHPVRIWAYCDDASARENSEAIYKFDVWLEKADLLWPHMTAELFMGPALPDNVVDPARIDALIGDEAIDVYVTEQLGPNRGGDQYSIGGGVVGLCVPASPPNSSNPRKTSAYVLVTEDAVFMLGRPLTLLAHELMHVLQHAHNATLLGGRETAAGDEFWWFADASAEWAAAYFDRLLVPDPGHRAAHDQIYTRFTNDFQSDVTIPLNAPDDSHRYAAFIWPYFMEQMIGPYIIAQAWEDLERADTWEQGDEALDAILPFRANLPKFAKRNINSDAYDPALPVAEQYESLDPEQWSDQVQVDPRFYPSHVAPLAVTHTDQIPVLTAQYWKFTFPDQNTKKVIIDLSDTAFGEPGLELEAMTYIQGEGWKAEMWNDEDQMVYCFDKPREHLEELWLIASNPMLESRGGSTEPIEFKVTVSDVPCETTWVGFTNVQIETSEVLLEYQTNVRWNPDEASTNDPLRPEFVPQGSVTLARWLDKRCGQNVVFAPRGSTMSTDPDLPDGLLAIDYTQDPPSVSLFGSSGWVGTATESCVTDPGTYDPWAFYAPWGGNSGSVFPTVSPDGTTIEGTWIVNEMTTTIHFTRVDQ